ncbi:MAG: GGDEF domain-containing protein [Gallionellaceae bacterium]|jgi:diguanylate cyclase (GGDEF)-like protein
MSFDSHTLLFSLILTNALMVFSLFVSTSNRSDSGRKDGMNKWAVALLLETLTWMLAAVRGSIPDLLSIIVLHGVKAAAYAMMLAAICEFQQRTMPRWQYIVPISLALLMAAVLVDDTRGRFFWGSLIFGFQMILIARALLSDANTRAGRSWRLMLGGICVVLLLLGTRATVALLGLGELAQPNSGAPPHWVQILSFIVVMSSTLLGSIGFILMVKERGDREIMQLAMTDSLTGVPNRRALMEHAERALARRNGSSLSLLMIDVDHFKHINDKYGHPVGDEALRQVAKLLLERLRGGDVLGRYGGEEFCVVAQDTDAEGAQKLGESLREIVAATPLLCESAEISVTVSIGISFCHLEQAVALKDMLAKADAALYCAKESGRNRVIVSQLPA